MYQLLKYLVKLQLVNFKIKNNQFQEFDKPHILLQNSTGFLTRLVEETGPAMALTLRKIAEEVCSFCTFIRIIFLFYKK